MWVYMYEDLIPTLHHHNKWTTPPHMRVDPTLMWGGVMLLLCWCCKSNIFHMYGSHMHESHQSVLLRKCCAKIIFHRRLTYFAIMWRWGMWVRIVSGREAFEGEGYCSKPSAVQERPRVWGMLQGEVSRQEFMRETRRYRNSDGRVPWRALLEWAHPLWP